MVKTIRVSDSVWERLMMLKIKLKARSLDEVISALLSKYTPIEIQKYTSTEMQKSTPVKIQKYTSTEVQKDKSTKIQETHFEDAYRDILREVYLDLVEAGGNPRRVRKDVLIELCKRKGLDMDKILMLTKVGLIRERPDGFMSIEI